MRARLAAIIGALATTSVAQAALVPAGAGIRSEPGVRASVYAKVTRPSAMTVDPSGRLWVATADGSDARTGTISLVGVRGAAARAVITKLKTPLGLLWFRNELYVSSTGRVDAYAGFAAGRFKTSRKVLGGLPSGLHQNNAIVDGPDGRLYLGLGSPCDACVPKDRRQATVLSFRPDGGDVKVVARGLRNPYGLAFVPGTSTLLITENGRDDLGVKQPPDELNRLVLGGPVPNFGYPKCWGQGGAPCAGTTPAFTKLPPHASSDGITVITKGPGAFGGSAAYIAQYGSSFKPPTGHDVVRVDVSTGASRSFAQGFANPLSVASTPEGALLVGDFGRNTIYQLAATR